MAFCGCNRVPACGMLCTFMEDRERPGASSGATTFMRSIFTSGTAGNVLYDFLPAGAAAALGAPDTPLAKAVRILNNQLQALITIEARTGELEGRYNQLDVATA